MSALGVKRTLPVAVQMSAYDPKRTSLYPFLNTRELLIVGPEMHRRIGPFGQERPNPRNALTVGLWMAVKLKQPKPSG
jgi:hypothetical protein